MQQVRVGLGKIAAQLLKQAPEEDAPALAWSVVAGTVVAGRTRVLAREGGVLRIEARDAGWRAELKGLEPQYRSAMNHLLKQPVERIAFVAPEARKPAANQSPPTGPPRRARSG
ncbi:MAG: DciA family protein [Terriglobales bacterium]